MTFLVALILALWDVYSVADELPSATLYHRRTEMATFHSPITNNLVLCREVAKQLREARNSKGYWCQA